MNGPKRATEAQRQQGEVRGPRAGRGPLVVGIDTGGTHTDAVLLEYSSREVLGAAKTLTTRADLTIGVTEALRQLPIDDPGTIELVGISTTLATNSVAEGKARPVGLLLVGYDPDLVERFDLASKLWASRFAFFGGGVDASGAEQAPLDRDRIAAWVQEQAGAVEAWAVSAYFSPLDPTHERQTRDLIAELSSLPVVLGHELSTQLDSVKRAATAALNASLVAAMSEFVHAVRGALSHRGIGAPLMVVKGDGSLMPHREATERPVDTILSGPAASAVGGQFLSQLQQALIVDMGGTTTDICLLDGSQVAVCDQGARVGEVRTAVRSARVTTVCLGCDSLLHPESEDGVAIGPNRAMPLCRLAAHSPSVTAELHRLEQRRSGELQPTDLEYWRLAADAEADDPPDDRRQRALVTVLGEGPRSARSVLSQLGVHHEVQLGLTQLERRGVIERAGLTPTDLLHALGRMDRWNLEAARCAVRLGARLAGSEAEPWCEAVIDELVARVAEQVVVFLAQHAGPAALPDAIEGAWARWLVDRGLSGPDALLTIELRCPLPLVGIGAPAAELLEGVAQRLHAPFVLPLDHAVANAAGAVAGSIIVRREAIVYCHDTEGRRSYRVQLEGEQRPFTELEAAQRFARERAAQAATDAAAAAGALASTVRVTRRLDGSLERYDARAVGSPPLSAADTSRRRARRGRPDRPHQGQQDDRPEARRIG